MLEDSNGWSSSTSGESQDVPLGRVGSTDGLALLGVQVREVVDVPRRSHKYGDVRDLSRGFGDFPVRVRGVADVPRRAHKYGDVRVHFRFRRFGDVYV